ncbi:MAG: proline--tRNA ligase [Defluviitaleaceae bacterium]|nr:proline--tRNA ligase [Defluviitaleaceae bacterium]
MKLDKLVGDRFKERPADCVIDSHALMMRGGYIKHVGNGIFSSYGVLRRVTRKIEEIIRQEMDGIDGQEVLFPVVMPASLWEESGRFESVGKELLRLTDRNDTQMLLGMTHEEAAVHLVREYGQTYAKYPFMIYQIQTKFRDEARPRGGLIRTREFTMKDAYSYHTSQEDLEAYYAKGHKAYERIFTRAGLKDVISVASDSGMMGGSVSHEFMLLTPIGEDSLVICSHCDFRANMENAESVVKNEAVSSADVLTKVHTPNTKSIEDVCTFLNLPLAQSCKAVIYQKAKTGEYVIIFIRGDLEVNEAKLTRLIQDELIPAVVTEESGLVAGYLGPVGLKNATIYFDNSLKDTGNLCCGANEADHHYTGFNIARDVENAEYHDFAKAVEGGICPTCHKPTLTLSRGIEVGNIFQLGDKYTKSMDMKYTDESGVQHHPIMGCYGIGIGRLAASIVEESHDEYGPIWPISVAPWHVHLCCVRAADPETKALADKLYAQLQASGKEVIYDDRSVSAGVMFSDADLLGVPIRVIVSPRNLKENCCEVVTRDKVVSEKIEISQVVSFVQKLKDEMETTLN